VEIVFLQQKTLLRKKKVIDFKKKNDFCNTKLKKKYFYRIDRERQRLQHEVIELTATIDQVQKDKVSIAISNILFKLIPLIIFFYYRIPILIHLTTSTIPYSCGKKSIH
jgi:hypothetical protein